jgi:hypothetical protein
MLAAEPLTMWRSTASATAAQPLVDSGSTIQEALSKHRTVLLLNERTANR